jgi:hypothetical protein
VTIFAQLIFLMFLDHFLEWDVIEAQLVLYFQIQGYIWKGKWNLKAKYKPFRRTVKAQVSYDIEDDVVLWKHVVHCSAFASLFLSKKALSKQPLACCTSLAVLFEGKVLLVSEQEVKQS